MADIDTLRHGGWTAFTDNPLRAADAITSLLDENERLRATLEKIANAYSDCAPLYRPIVCDDARRALAHP